MSASSRACVLLRGGIAQWARRAPLQRLPFAVAVVGGRRWHTVGGKTADNLGATTYEAVASESSESEVSETSSSTAESTLSATSSDTSVGEAASTKDPWTPEFGFAFDIDGVLLHKADPIPGATETLKYLQEHKIPFILLTNGGGKSEADRVAELSAKLGVDLDTSNFVQSHTPYQLLAAKPPATVPHSNLPGHLKESSGVKSLRDSTVLVLGSDASRARRIAQGYGFRTVVTPGDILKAHPTIFPFDPLSEFYSKQETLPLPKPVYDPQNSNLKLEDCLKIDAILVFNDPRDWAFDIQLITDLLLSHRGYLGTYSKKNGDPSLPLIERWQSDGQPPLVFSNIDLLWSTGYHLPRFGQGAFRSAVRGAFAEIMKQSEGGKVGTHKLRDHKFGKPELSMYNLAASRLLKHFEGMWRAGPGTEKQVLEGTDDEVRRLQQPTETEGNLVGQKSLPKLRKVYMVGDNPQSDIRGAVRWRHYLDHLPLSAGLRTRKDVVPSWEACLVRTGVWNEETLPLEKLAIWKAKPDTVQDDVKAVLRWVLQKEGWPENID